MATQKKQEQTSTATVTAPKPQVEAVKPIITPTKAKTFQDLPFLFDKQNYMFMAIGLVFIIIGYMLMSGGRSADPNVFDGDSLYSFRRITLAPVLILIGLGIEVYAIMRKPVNTK